ALAKGLYLAVLGNRHLDPHVTRFQSVVHILTSRLKFPPAPVYLLFYGGLGLGILSLWLVAEHDSRFARVSSFAAMLGQNSLVMFVSQAAVYYTLVHDIHERLPYASWGWPLYLAVSMVFVVVPTWAWHRLGYRKYLTVGYRQWRERHLLDAYEGR